MRETWVQFLGWEDPLEKGERLPTPVFWPGELHLIFLVVVYGCESWIIQKAERRRIDAFKLWCWRRLLRVSWTARRSNHSILKVISSEYSLGGLMLKLTLQYCVNLM